MRRASWLAMIVMLLLLAAAPVTVFAQSDAAEPSEEQPIAIIWDGEPVALEEPPIWKDGRIFVPVREFAVYFGATAQWDGDAREVRIETEHGDRLVFAVDQPRMIFNDVEYYMDVEPFIEDGKAYIPVRHAAEFLHIDVAWEADSHEITLTSKPIFYYTAEVDIAIIAEHLGVELEHLLERNGLQSVSELKPNTYLKVLIPDLVINKIEPPEPEPEPEPVEAAFACAYTEEELLLLAKLVQVEAGYEPYEGQLAVANVVLNRVADNRFPDSIHGVIYAKGQFPPAHNGKLDRAEPSESAWRAAEAALSGENVVDDALYFYNPKVSKGSYWNRLTFVKQIGNHRFMK